MVDRQRVRDSNLCIHWKEVTWHDVRGYAWTTDGADLMGLRSWPVLLRSEKGELTAC